MRYLKIKKFLVSIVLAILIFFSFTNEVQASIFSDDDDKSSIEETIEKDEGGLFEKIIAKMIRRYSRNSI